MKIKTKIKIFFTKKGIMKDKKLQYLFNNMFYSEKNFKQINKKK